MIKIYKVEPDSEVVFWNNDQGWVDEESATTFTVLPADSLPIGWHGVTV